MTPSMRSRLFAACAMLTLTLGCAHARWPNALSYPRPAERRDQHLAREVGERFLAAVYSKDDTELQRYVSTDSALFLIRSWRSGFPVMMNTAPRPRLLGVIYDDSTRIHLTMQVQVAWVRCVPPAHEGTGQVLTFKLERVSAGFLVRNLSASVC